MTSWRRTACVFRSTNVCTHTFQLCSHIPDSILKSVSSGVLHLNLCRPDRGVDAHVVRSCCSLHGRGKTRGDEGQPSRFTSPPGTASQHPAGDRRRLLTSAGKSTDK